MKKTILQIEDEESIRMLVSDILDKKLYNYIGVGSVEEGLEIIEKKLLLLFYGLGFVFLRYLDAILFLYTLPLAFRIRSDGKWVSPNRRLSKQSVEK